ncbi:MAG: hypothetical protein O7C59_10550 [Rickettsia endosymbiont of Ixodes persulcatus]|nr:hypothetical protein [Rickettsia endosymbiont of Ixodes persulcatus]
MMLLLKSEFWSRFMLCGVVMCERIVVVVVELMYVRGVVVIIIDEVLVVSMMSKLQFY